MTAQTAFRALARGLAAGAVGTTVMTLSQEAKGRIRRGRSPLASAILGTAVWGLRHAVLPPLEVDEPIWKKSPDQLALDLSHHLAYGLSVAGAHRALAER